MTNAPLFAGPPRRALQSLFVSKRNLVHKSGTQTHAALTVYKRHAKAARAEQHMKLRAAAGKRRQWHVRQARCRAVCAPRAPRCPLPLSVANFTLLPPARLPHSHRASPSCSS